MTEATTVDAVKPGDEIYVHRTRGYKLVAEVNHYEDDIVVVYFDRDQASYENRARDKSGFNTRSMRVLKSLRPMPAGEPVVVVRGSAGAADTEMRLLEREQLERWATTASRRERAEARRP